MIRVLLAEDQALVRGALATLLNLEPDVEVVGEVGRGDAVLTSVEAVQPDVVLLDIELPGMNGLEVAERLAQARIPCKVVVLTTFGRPGYLERAMAADVAGYLLKDTPAEQLAQDIRRIMAGTRIVDPSLAAMAALAGRSPLTAREADVLRASAAGASVEEVAHSLHLAEGTVRNYLSSAIQKLGARNRLEAAARAERNGWI